MPKDSLLINDLLLLSRYWYFKSALLILGATMLSLIVCVNGFHYLHIDFRLPNAIISSIVCGLSVAYSQFYIERKKGMCKSFWIVAGIFTIMAFVMILMIRYEDKICLKTSRTL